MYLQSELQVAAVACCLAGAACSPYPYQEQVESVSAPVAAASDYLRTGDQALRDERRENSRLEWSRRRPRLYIVGCLEHGEDPVCTVSDVEPAPLATGDVPGSTPTPESAGPAGTRDACDQVGAPPLDSPPATPRAGLAATELRQGDVLDDIRRYMEGLAALTRAEDRKAFDEAAAKLGASVGALTANAGAAAGGIGVAAGPLATASADLLLWLVGTGLDHRRLALLREATRQACRPIRLLARAVEVRIGEQRGNRLSALAATIAWRVQALNVARSRRVSEQEYRQAVDRLFVAIDTYEAVRAIDPRALAQAMATAHDNLALAVYRGDRQFEGLVKAAQTLLGNVQALAAAARASAPDATAKQEASRG